MENIEFWHYIRPELFLVSAAVYVTGIFLKKSKDFQDKFIPVTLGTLSVVVCLIYFLSTAQSFNANALFGILFDSLTQGILIAGCAVYANQLVKQREKKDDK